MTSRASFLVWLLCYPQNVSRQAPHMLSIAGGREVPGADLAWHLSKWLYLMLTVWPTGGIAVKRRRGGLLCESTARNTVLAKPWEEGAVSLVGCGGVGDCLHGTVWRNVASKRVVVPSGNERTLLPRWKTLESKLSGVPHCILKSVFERQRKKERLF